LISEIAMTDENDRLDQAMQRADELLRDSLKSEESRRFRNKLMLTGGVVAVIGIVAIALWALQDNRGAGTVEPLRQQTMTTPATSNAALADAYDDVIRSYSNAESLSAQLLALGDDWRKAFALGQKLAAADPDAALAALNNNWSRIAPLQARQQLLKAFAFASHPRVLDVLHLGMTDSEPQVQGWACNYLRDYAFEDFAHNRAAYEEWRKQTQGKPLAEVTAQAARGFIARLAAASGDKLSAQLKVLEAARGGLRNPAARSAAIDAGALDLAARWLRDSAAKPDLVGGASHLIAALQPGEKYLRDVILPLLGAKHPMELRATAARLLARPENKWAVDPLLAVLRDSIQSDTKHLAWDVADALGEIGDPRAIPTMIAVIDADNTYDTIYGVGYFGLSEMTGVDYDETHDGKWWRQWWEREKARFPEPARSATIPTIDKSSSAARGVANPIYATMLQEEPAVKDLRANNDENMRFFLIGPATKEEPKDGYHLLLVLPGGDGSADFHGFVKNMLNNAMPENYIIAQLVAPIWTAGEDRIIWPTENSRDPKMKFPTEKFIDAVVADVKKLHKIDPKHIYALGWSSGGPPVYYAATRKDTPLTGAFVAMSVFKPHELPPNPKLTGRKFYILHSPTDFIKMTFPNNAKRTLSAAGAKVTLKTYEGGHGWVGDPFGMIRAGMDWLEQQ
jgi:predicted esterase